MFDSWPKVIHAACVIQTTTTQESGTKQNTCATASAPACAQLPCTTSDNVSVAPDTLELGIARPAASVNMARRELQANDANLVRARCLSQHVCHLAEEGQYQRSEWQHTHHFGLHAENRKRQITHCHAASQMHANQSTCKSCAARLGRTLQSQ